ncbi:DUF962 domain-containing protein [Myxococcota bacterium]|nr:DUF962 domain-containing protein [Myxococcota bacterium]
MKRIDFASLLVEFARWHQDPNNRGCHYVGLPAVTLPVLGLLARVQLGVQLPFELGELDLALVLLAATFVFDLWLAWQLAPGVLGLGLALWWLGRSLPLEALGVIFAIGWAFQLVGHRVFEKNAPAFTDNLVHTVIGPRWLVNRIVRIYPETPR